jgi:hypothetical protein
MHILSYLAFFLIYGYKSFMSYIINLELGVVAQAVIPDLRRLTQEDMSLRRTWAKW